MNIESVVLSGARVKLLPMEIDHIHALFEVGNTPAIWPYMPMQIRNPEDMEQLVKDALSAREQGVAFPFVIFDLKLNKIVGSTRLLDISVPNRRLEIGWTWLSPEVWRTSVNTECKLLLLNHCFEKLKTIRVQLKTDERNVRSQEAISRLGAIKEGTLRNHRILSDGFYRNTVYFSILDTEWPAVKEKLIGYLTNQ